MRDLARPGVLQNSAVAALITASACYPRLAAWSDRSQHVWFLWLVLLWSAFVLWAFVFAWQSLYARRPVFVLDRQPRFWGLVCLAGIAMAVGLHRFLDPVLRSLMPGEYPADLKSWLAMALFALAFEPLFLCFAPLAFFSRLFGKRTVAVTLTVMFGIALVILKVRTSKLSLAPILLAQLLIVRALAGGLTAWFYLKGGVLPVLAWALLLQLRHLLVLLSAH